MKYLLRTITLTTCLLSAMSNVQSAGTIQLLKNSINPTAAVFIASCLVPQGSLYYSNLEAEEGIYLAGTGPAYGSEKPSKKKLAITNNILTDGIQFGLLLGTAAYYQSAPFKSWTTLANLTAFAIPQLYHLYKERPLRKASEDAEGLMSLHEIRLDLQQYHKSVFGLGATSIAVIACGLYSRNMTAVKTGVAGLSVFYFLAHPKTIK